MWFQEKKPFDKKDLNGRENFVENIDFSKAQTRILMQKNDLWYEKKPPGAINKIVCSLTVFKFKLTWTRVKNQSGCVPYMLQSVMRVYVLVLCFFPCFHGSSLFFLPFSFMLYWIQHTPPRWTIEGSSIGHQMTFILTLFYLFPKPQLLPFDPNSIIVFFFFV